MRLEAHGLVRTINGRPVVDGIDVRLGAGQTLAVVGPSGCGKTSLLRVLAGLDPLRAGRVLVDGDDVTALGPERRAIAMVFQDDSLFPELTVADNVGFGLSRRGSSRARRDEAVEVALLRFGLTGLESRWPHQLSGGQRRRVGLARALVTQPAALLLDEPLAGLDDLSRAQVTRQLGDVQRRQHLAIVHVTHDQAEALAAGDQLMVMDDGRCVQQGPPREVFHRPSTVEIAALLGRSNFLDVEVEQVAPDGSGRAQVRVLGRSTWVACPPQVTASTRRATLVVRPHCISLEQLPPDIGWQEREVFGSQGIVQQSRFRGSSMEHLVETEQGVLLHDSPVSEELAPGTRVRVGLFAERTWLLPPS